MESKPELTSKREWVDRIEKASSEALTRVEIDRIYGEYDEAVRAFMNGEITQAQYGAHQKLVVETPGLVIAKNLPEYRALLIATGRPLSEVNNVLAHENAHMTEALKLNFTAVYRVQCIKEENGTINLLPAVQFKFPEGTPDEVLREQLRVITEAPDDLSPSDRHKLGYNSSAK